MKRRSRVLLIAEDAGGAAALAPVFRALRAKLGSRVVLTYERPDVIVAAPGAWGLGADKRAILRGKMLHTPTIGLVDYWGNNASRFSTPGTCDLAFLPDVVCVIDVQAKREAIADGIPARRIIVTGNPYFETFAAAKGKGTDIVFFCQPFSELKRKNPKADCGVDERQVLGDLLTALDEASIPGRLIVKLHPRTTQPHKFDRILEATKRRVLIDRATQPNKLIARARLVLGMSSMALFEAALSGKPVLSYQPGLKRPDTLRSNALGLSLSVHKKDGLKAALRQLITRRTSVKTRTMRDKYVRGHATEKMLQVIQQML